MKNSQKSTFQLIIHALNKSKDLSAHDLSLECGIGEPAIRYHLRKMKEAGLINEFDTGNQRFRAGRRFHKYRILSNESADSLRNLCCSLLRIVAINQMTDPQRISRVIAENLIGNAFLKSKRGPATYLELITWLNSRHYQARWDAGKTGPVIHFENCPYRTIREGNDLLCEIDAEILQKLTGIEWEQTDHLDWENIHGECVFTVKQNG